LGSSSTDVSVEAHNKVGRRELPAVERIPNNWRVHVMIWDKAADSGNFDAT
jgi:hypothetical protein